MSRVESGGQKAAPKIFAGAEQISPPAVISKQKEMTKKKTLWPFHKKCAASYQPRTQRLLRLRDLRPQAEVPLINWLSGGKKRKKGLEGISK